MVTVPFLQYPFHSLCRGQRSQSVLRAGLRCAVLLILLSSMALLWLWGGPVVQALEFQVPKMQQVMQQRFGDAGSKRLQAWLQFLEQQTGRQGNALLQSVNDYWNVAVMGSEDAQIWGETEYWATPLEALGKGAADCEDFVIGKYFSLLRLGVPVEKLRFIYVRARLGGIGSTQSIAHMVLGYYETPQAEPLVLDNLVGTMLPASQRKDLTPVFSFNAQGIYVAGAQPSSVERISRWKGLMARMQQEGFVP